MYRSKQLLLITGDLLVLGIGLWLSLAARYLAIPNKELLGDHLPLFSGLLVLWLIINYINGLYDLARLRGLAHYKRQVESALFAFLVSVLVLYALPQPLTPKTILALAVLFGFSLSFGWRLLFSSIPAIKNLHTRVIFVGFNDEIRELIDLLHKSPENGYRVIALFDPLHELKTLEPKTITLYHSLQALRPAITTHRADIVVTAPHLKENADTLRELYELLFWPVQILDLSSFYEAIAGKVPPSTFSDGWFLSNLANITQPLYCKVRRIVDYIAGLIMSLACLVLTPVVALIIKLDSRGPVFYGQKRIGQYGAIFTIYKFRTMYALSPDGSAEKGRAVFAQKDDKRVTRAGKFLRKTRLDELPQFINLIKGDITLIGPRPERPEIVAKLEARMPYYPLRHLVKPGITGWAAINQHYTSTFDQAIQKLQYDLFYIKNRSFSLDLSILLRTVNVVLRMMGQ